MIYLALNLDGISLFLFCSASESSYWNRFKSNHGVISLQLTFTFIFLMLIGAHVI